jgi:hypothetical protein
VEARLEGGIGKPTARRFNWERFSSSKQQAPPGATMALRDSEMPVGLVYPRKCCLG